MNIYDGLAVLTLVVGMLVCVTMVGAAVQRRDVAQAFLAAGGAFLVFGVLWVFLLHWEITTNSLSTYTNQTELAFCLPFSIGIILMGVGASMIASAKSRDSGRLETARREQATFREDARFKDTIEEGD